MSESEELESTTYMPGNPDDLDFLIMDLDSLHSKLNTTRVSSFYIDTQEEANYTQVMEDIRNIAPYSFVSVRSSAQAIDEVYDSRGGRTIHGIYTLNVIFSILYLTIGISIIAADKNRMYRKQFAIMRAMGSDSTSIQSTLLLDTLVNIVLASAIGILTGLFLSHMVLGTPLTYMGLSETLAWDHLPVSLSIPVFRIGLIYFIGYAFPMAAAFFVTRSNLRRGIAHRLQVAG